MRGTTAIATTWSTCPRLPFGQTCRPCATNFAFKLRVGVEPIVNWCVGLRAVVISRRSPDNFAHPWWSPSASLPFHEKPPAGVSPNHQTKRGGLPAHHGLFPHLFEPTDVSIESSKRRHYANIQRRSSRARSLLLPPGCSARHAPRRRPPHHDRAAVSALAPARARPSCRLAAARSPS